MELTMNLKQALANYIIEYARHDVFEKTFYDAPTHKNFNL